ncbi:hypothetical protein FOCC_FOCC012732 [Frankliniella occidentalis]|nr:hypothetical protein FOCC_FOCC012732 [Frankliniella occidentalis]
MTSRSKSGSKMGDLNRSELESIISEAVAVAILPLTTQIQNLCGEVEKLKSELKVKDEAINSLQYGRRNNIRIFGLPENKNEDTDKLVIDVAKRRSGVVKYWQIAPCGNHKMHNTAPDSCQIHQLCHKETNILVKETSEKFENGDTGGHHS